MSAASLLGLLLAAAGPQYLYPVELPPHPGTVRRLEFHSARDGWAVVGDALLHYDGQRWATVPGPPGKRSLGWLSVVGEQELLVFAEGSELYRYDRGRWERVEHSLGAFELNAMDARTSALAYVGGAFGLVARYDGRTLHQVAAPGLSFDRESHLSGLAVLAEDDVWFGGFDFLLHFDGQGWTRQAPPAPLRSALVFRVGDRAFVSDPSFRPDAPTFVWRDGRWEPFAPKALVAVAEFRGQTLAIAADRTLVRVESPTRLEPAAAHARELVELEATEEALWAVGVDGALLRLHDERIPSFVDATYEAGLGFLGASLSGASGDLDGDGRPDILVFTKDKTHLWTHTRTGRFEERPLEPDPVRALRGANELVLADLDGDGRVDVASRDGATKLLRAAYNLGELRFDVRLFPNANPDLHDAAGLGAADLDGDGALDLYDMHLLDKAGLPLPNVLWRNDRLGRFSPRLLFEHDGGASLSWSAVPALGDFDGDGRTDLVSANSWGAGHSLYLSTREGTLRDATFGSGVRGAYPVTVGTAQGDVDGDGDLDLLTLAADFHAPSRLFRNDGGGRFHDVTAAAGLVVVTSFGTGRARFADLDNDTDLDLFLAGAAPFLRERADTGHGPKVFLNDGKGHFTDVTVMTGLGNGPISDALVEDFDGDGDLDLFLIRFGEPNRLLLNDTAGDRWLKVQLEGTAPNRAAVGAVVRAYREGRLLAHREVSARWPAVHLGLGGPDPVSLEVRFPSGTIEQLAEVSLGQTVTVREGNWVARGVRRAGLWMERALAWADLQREAWKLAVALAAVLLALRVARLIGARRFVPRPWAVAGLVGGYLALALGSARPAVVLPFWDALPLGALGVGLLALLGVDRRSTRLRESRFIGPYEVLAVLGQGGMGTVYRARKGPGEGELALKVLRPDRVGDRESLQRFAREAEIGARLDHPNVVRVLGSGECRVQDGGLWKQTAYIAMELVEGRTLAERLAQGEAFSERASVEATLGVAEALAAAHAQGVLHRDVKPENIFLGKNGAVKLGDFGVAALAQATTLTEVGTAVGTLRYMAPERVRGRDVDARSDVYSLAAVLYEMLCGRQPFASRDSATLIAEILTEEPPPPSSLRPGLSPRLDALLRAALSKQPSERPSSARVFAASLREVLAGWDAPEPPSRRQPQVTEPLVGPPPDDE